MKVYIGADHRGFNLKEKIKDWIPQEDFETEDLGAFKLDPDDDYPIIAQKVAKSVSEDLEKETQSRGIVICGSGAGVDIVANKFRHIRCGLSINHQQVKKAREDDDINVLALSSDYLTESEARDSVNAFLNSNFSGDERKERRIEEIEKIEDDK